MNLAMMLYAVEVISNFNDFLNIIIVIFIVICAVLGLITLLSMSDDVFLDKIFGAWKYIYKRIWIMIIVFLIVIITPTKQTMYLMLGSSYLSQSNIPAKVSAALELKLDDVIQKLKDKDKK